MSKFEENTQIPSTHKTEEQTDGCPTSSYKETKHAEDAGQKNGPRPTVGDVKKQMVVLSYTGFAALCNG